MGELKKFIFTKEKQYTQRITRVANLQCFDVKISQLYTAHVGSQVTLNTSPGPNTQYLQDNFERLIKLSAIKIKIPITNDDRKF